MSSYWKEFYGCNRSRYYTKGRAMAEGEEMNKCQDVIYELDGNQWCAHRIDFIDLQNSLAGFGDTQNDALKDLLAKESEGKNE